MAEPRIVSLLPALTEIVAALDMAHLLVGRSHECDNPPEVAGLPALTSPKFVPDHDGLEVHQQVMDILKQGLSVYAVDAAQLKALKPDVILTQTQCEVCAASEEDVKAAVAEMLDPKPEVVAVAPEKLEDVWNNILQIARALGVEEKGQSLVNELQERTNSITRRAKKLKAQPSVATIEWMNPLMAGGNWMPELVNMAGGTNMFGKAGQHSPWLEWEVLQTADPDILLVLPCGYSITQSQREIHHLTQREGWAHLTAVQEGRVYVLDGNAYFNRPGPRLVESLEILAEVIHPDQFNFGHQESGWIRLGA